MSKLQILIPQYNEDENIIKHLLDSIAIQQNIDFNDIEVFIGNDGSDIKLSVDFLKTYKYRIQYHYFEHGRLAATRKKLFDLSTADYVMWCDADDFFISTIALSIILQRIDVGFDALIGEFIEENHYTDGRIAYIPHENDPIFVHGKIYRRQFLLDNKIEWHSELHEHQDSPFNVLARICSKNTQIIKMPIYMWHSNPNSICRKDGIYHSPNTWCHMIDSYEALIEDLKDRAYSSQGCYYSKYCLYATYFELAHGIWKQDDVQERKFMVYKRLADFYFRHEMLIRHCDEKMTEQIIKITKERASKKGKLNNMPPFEEWLECILKLYKGA